MSKQASLRKSRHRFARRMAVAPFPARSGRHAPPAASSYRAALGGILTPPTSCAEFCGQLAWRRRASSIAAGRACARSHSRAASYRPRMRHRAYGAAWNEAAARRAHIVIIIIPASCWPMREMHTSSIGSIASPLFSMSSEVGICRPV